ncbi:MAG TPA: hypothetical protein VGW38_29510, partial [Chloroflexota bacterium]|nr:hypothetical protein [Chloroflexota bacterium]
MRAEETRVTTVVLGIHHTLWRHGLRALLQEAGGYSVLADVGTAREVYLLAARHRPDIVLMDVDLIDHPATTPETLANDVAGNGFVERCLCGRQVPLRPHRRHIGHDRWHCSFVLPTVFRGAASLLHPMWLRFA